MVLEVQQYPFLIFEQANPFLSGMSAIEDISKKKVARREQLMRQKFLPELLKAQLEQEKLAPELTQARIRGITEGTLPYQQALTAAHPGIMDLKQRLTKAQIRSIEEGDIPSKEARTKKDKELTKYLVRLKKAEIKFKGEQAELAKKRGDEITEGKIDYWKHRAKPWTQKFAEGLDYLLLRGGQPPQGQYPQQQPPPGQPPTMQPSQQQGLTNTNDPFEAMGIDPRELLRR